MWGIFDFQIKKNIAAELQKHKYPSILVTEEHLFRIHTVFCPHFDYINCQEISSIKFIYLILLIFSCYSDSLIKFYLFSKNQLLTQKFPYWGCSALAYLRISSLRLPCNILLENFLIEAALRLLDLEFPHWGCLETGCFRISSLWLFIHKNFILENS